MQIKQLFYISKKMLKGLRLRVYPDISEDYGARLNTQIRLEGLLAAIVLNLATVFTAMFATRLGASADKIGLLSSLPQLAGLLVLLPGTILAGRSCLSRRPVELSILATGLLYGLAALAPYMGDYQVSYLILMVTLANAPMSLYNTSWQNYFSDLVPAQQRNNLYAMRTSMTFAAGIVVVQLTGLLLARAASDQARLHMYQLCYLVAFIFSIFQWLVLRQSPQVHSSDSTYGARELWLAVKAIPSHKSFLAFISMSFIFHVGWYMAFPLFFLAQVHYMQANEAWLSYVTVSASLVQWLTVKYWSRFIDRHGIRLGLVVGAFGLTVNPLFAILSTYFPLGWRMPAMVTFNLVNAATYSSFQLSILQCLFEVVPARFKQINLSLYTTLLLFANTLMQFLGVKVYVLLGKDHRAMTLSLLIASAIRLLGTLLFFLRWYKLRYEPDAGKRFS